MIIYHDTQNRIVHLYSIKEAANLLSVDEQTIRLWISNKKLKGFKIGRLWRIEENELNRFIRGDYSRAIFKDIDLIKNSTMELWILGINALGPLHQGREAIIEALLRGVNVRILLLDPDSNAFHQRQQKEEYVNERTAGRLRAEFNASVAICKDIQNFIWHKGTNVGKIEVKTYADTPTKSLIIIDPSTPFGRVNVNIYPIEELVRGITGGQRTIYPAYPEINEFIDHVSYFDKLWAHSKMIDIHIQ